MPPQEQRKLAAIMFTDMVGFSALSQRDESLGLEMLEEHREKVREIIPRHDGREVKTMGDGFLLEFPGALAAVAIQQALHEHNREAPGDRQVHLRIGIHVGDVVLRDAPATDGTRRFSNEMSPAGRLQTRAGVRRPSTHSLTLASWIVAHTEGRNRRRLKQFGLVRAIRQSPPCRDPANMPSFPP